MIFWNRTPQQYKIERSILPDVAKHEIEQGRLPIIRVSNIFLKAGESCHFVDKAILNVEKTKKYYRQMGRSYKGLFGNRVNYGETIPVEYKNTQQTKGILYITNKRLIFQARENGFEKGHKALTAVETYVNAIVLQYNQKTYTLIVADGNLVSAVLNMVT